MDFKWNLSAAARKVVRTVFFMVLLSWVLKPAFAGPWDKKSPKELTQSASMRYVGEEPEVDLYQAIRGGDVVLTGKLERIVTKGVGVMRLPVHWTEVHLKDVDVIQGSPPAENNFRYPNTAPQIREARNAKVIVVLNRTAKLAKEYQIVAMGPANKANLSLVKEAMSRAKTEAPDVSEEINA